MDWGFGPPLVLLTDDMVRQFDFYTRVWGNHGEPALIEELTPLLSRLNTLFLFHTQPFTQFPAVRVIFEKAVARSGKRTALVRTFFQGTGDPVACLLRVE